MTVVQASKFATYQNVAQFIEQHLPNLSVSSRLHKEATIYLTHFNELSTLVGKQTQYHTLFVTEQKSIFDKMVLTIVGICKVAFVWAKDTQQYTLKDIFHVSPVLFKKKTTKETIAHVRHLYNLLDIYKEHLISNYGIQQAQLDDALQLIMEFEVLIRPTDDIKNGRLHMVRFFQLMDDHLENLSCLLHNPTPNNAFETSTTNLESHSSTIVATTLSPHQHNKLLQAYQLSLQPVLVGKITGLRIHFSDVTTTLPIANACVHIVHLKRQALSNQEGVAEIIKMQFGTYHVHFSANGYLTKQLYLKIERGKLLELAVVLDKLPPESTSII